MLRLKSGQLVTFWIVDLFDAILDKNDYFMKTYVKVHFNLFSELFLTSGVKIGG